MFVFCIGQRYTWKYNSDALVTDWHFMVFFFFSSSSSSSFFFFYFFCSSTFSSSLFSFSSFLFSFSSSFFFISFFCFRHYNFSLWMFWLSQHMISTKYDPGCSYSNSLFSISSCCFLCHLPVCSLVSIVVVLTLVSTYKLLLPFSCLAFDVNGQTSLIVVLLCDLLYS